MDDFSDMPPFFRPYAALLGREYVEKKAAEILNAQPLTEVLRHVRIESLTKQETTMINEAEKLKVMREEHARDVERDGEDAKVMDAYAMNEIMQEVVGQSYRQSVFDGRGGTWLSPKAVVEAVRLSLEAMDILLEPPHDESEEDEE